MAAAAGTPTSCSTLVIVVERDGDSHVVPFAQMALHDRQCLVVARMTLADALREARSTEERPRAVLILVVYRSLSNTRDNLASWFGVDEWEQLQAMTSEKL